MNYIFGVEFKAKHPELVGGILVIVAAVTRAEAVDIAVAYVNSGKLYANRVEYKGTGARSLQAVTEHEHGVITVYDFLHRCKR